jgi:hypothetical protein
MTDHLRTPAFLKYATAASALLALVAVVKLVTL